MDGSNSVRKPACCPACGSRRLWWNGWRVRTLTIMDGGAASYRHGVRVRRVVCARCRHGWCLPPPRAVVREHYQPCVAARGVAMWLRGTAMDRVGRALGCSRRTVSRWLRRFAGRGRRRDERWWRFAARVCRLLAEATVAGSTIPDVAR